MMKKQTTNLLLVLLAGILSGCASFQGNQLDRVSDYPSVRRKKSIHATLVFKGKLNGEPWPQNDARNQAYLKQRYLEHLESCGMFSVVPGDPDTTDFKLHIALVNEKETGAIRQTLSTLTLFLIPYTSTDTFRMLAVLEEPATGKKKKIWLTQTVNHRQQLFLLPFAPFKSSDSEIKKAVDRLLENLFMEIHRVDIAR
ncbi:MAG: hypothetical protein ABFR33_06570 [Verrucomicrobiota bacterium]